LLVACGRGAVAQQEGGDGGWQVARATTYGAPASFASIFDPSRCVRGLPEVAVASERAAAGVRIRAGGLSRLPPRSGTQRPRTPHPHPLLRPLAAAPRARALTCLAPPGATEALESWLLGAAASQTATAPCPSRAPRTRPAQTQTRTSRVMHAERRARAFRGPASAPVGRARAHAPAAGLLRSQQTGIATGAGAALCEGAACRRGRARVGPTGCRATVTNEQRACRRRSRAAAAPAAPSPPPSPAAGRAPSPPAPSSTCAC
jgi:hypothetical protein